MGEYYFSLSSSELQQWLIDDKLTVSADRFVLFPRDFFQPSNTWKNNDMESMQVKQLLARLPAFALDDSAGAVICKVNEPGNWSPTRIPGIYTLHLKNALEFIPLTQEGFDIIGLRFELFIKISPPRFEAYFINYRYEEKANLSKHLGDLLVKSLIKFDNNIFSISEEITIFLPEALKFAEHASESESADEVLLHKNWLNLIFGHRRSKPLKNHEIINNIADIGIILASIENNIDAKLTPEINDFIGKLNNFRDKWRLLYERLKSMPSISDAMLGEIYSDSELNYLKIYFVEEFSGPNKISIVSMGLFLYWKQRFHNQNSHVDFHALISDLKSLVNRVPINDTAIALWLFGAYLGANQVLPFYRYLHKEKYISLNFPDNITEFKPINAWEETSFIKPSIGDPENTENPPIATEKTTGTEGTKIQNLGVSENTDSSHTTKKSNPTQEPLPLSDPPVEEEKQSQKQPMENPAPEASSDSQSAHNTEMARQLDGKKVMLVNFARHPLLQQQLQDYLKELGATVVVGPPSRMTNNVSFVVAGNTGNKQTNVQECAGKRKISVLQYEADQFNEADLLNLLASLGPSAPPLK